MNYPKLRSKLSSWKLQVYCCCSFRITLITWIAVYTYGP